MSEHQPDLIPNPAIQPSPEAEARRTAARARLAELLKDPQFRAIEGFPIGTDEDILALSDPPYYTACPNPFLPEIISEWQQERETLRKELGLSTETYPREPFAADVSEGKNDPIYNAHSYHTKVPHKAIMRYILHYTDPGDIVFDGFCGTGMTGVAAQLCGDKKAVEELGYRVDEQGMVWEGNKTITRLGARKAVLNDLSPAATFIAYNYNTPVDTAAFEREARRILKEVEEECGWMYETWHPNCDDPKRAKGQINYTVWSEVFTCPQCGKELVYFDVAIEKETFAVNDNFKCPFCGTALDKKSLDRVWESYYDQSLQQTHKLVKYKPVRIFYQLGKQRYEKQPDQEDLNILEKIEQTAVPGWFPAGEMLDGERKGKDGYHLKGITYLHHFYFHRPLNVYSKLWEKASSDPNKSALNFTKFFIQGSCLGFTKLNRYQPIQFGRVGGSQVNRYFSGTLFVGSLISEVSPAYSMTHKLERLIKLHMPGQNGGSLITCQSTTNITGFPSNSVDYIFIDPPFGNNLHYSELNYFWESWLRLLTEREPEAVMDKGRHRTLADYEKLMYSAFQELYRVIRPGRWMTVEFHNSQNSVWNAIQLSLQQAGFVVADVRTLDKQQETYKQSIQNLVKQDLIITAYKPNGRLEENFHLKAGSEDGVWEFVRYHLGKLPILNQHDGQLIVNAERQAFLLFDRMVAFHVQHGVMVPISAPEFYGGLQQRFISRDGMYFLPEQVTEYDRAVIDSKGVVQLSLFVSDEKSAITWLRQQLDPASEGEPQTRGDLTNKFNQTMHRAKHETALELIEILEQNFLEDPTGKWFVPDHNKASDLDRVRQRSLLKEFNEYAISTGRLRQFRTEAVRAGFADCFKRQDYETIVKVAERLPEDVLREDPDLLMYYDSATLRKK
ncbi:MAG: DNA methyltransferase [Anaerolineaceae bacterium]|nr:DNA methyltransferase [Anaerolineaceae bacterium]